MIRALFVPANEDSVVELDLTDELQKETNPYFVSQEFIKAYTERVRTPIVDIAMFVDELGMIKKLPENKRVSFKLYPGPIFGDVVILKTEEIYTEDGPDQRVVHMPDNTTELLQQMMSGEVE